MFRGIAKMQPLSRAAGLSDFLAVTGSFKLLGT